MWLTIFRRQNLVWDEPGDLIVPCRVDVWASVDFDAYADDDTGPTEFIVGRILADEIQRYRIEDYGVEVWDAADADSSGLMAAWAALLDEQGYYREEELDTIGDPVVYLYRFALHPEFAEWRMAVMDAFCRQFDEGAIILAQYHTTLFSETEFAELGFIDLPPARFRGHSSFANPDKEIEFKARINCNVCRFGIADYPVTTPGATARHTEWLEAQGKWESLF